MLNLSPTSPAGWMWLNLKARLDRVRSQDERGASAIEWVIITAIVVGLAGIVGTIIWNLVQDESSKINDGGLPGG